MPAKKGFCWCLGSRAPPEISYGVENGGMTVKPIEVDLPMPQDEEELNAVFSELVVGGIYVTCLPPLYSLYPKYNTLAPRNPPNSFPWYICQDSYLCCT